MKKATTKTAEPQVNVTIKRLNATQITRLQKQLELLTKEKLAKEEKRAAEARATGYIGSGRRLLALMETHPDVRKAFLKEINEALAKNATNLSIGNEAQFPVVSKHVRDFCAKDSAVAVDINAKTAARKKAIVERKEAILNQVYFGNTAPDVCALLAEFNNF